MTTPPPPPSGPYAQQPGRQPGFGPAPGPYGAPGQPPYPQPAWGGGPPFAPPPPPPPKNRGGGKAVVIALAIIIPLGGLATSMLKRAEEYGSSKRSSGSAHRTAEYEISMPSSVLDGRLTLAEDMSDDPEFKVPGLGSGSEQFTGWYTDRDETERYVFNGYNSVLARRDESAHKILDGAVGSSYAPSPPKRHRITPPGTDRDILCVVLRQKERGQILTVPTCAWDDNGSAAMVMDNSDETNRTNPAAYDLKAFAQEVHEIREDVRKPA